jgi:hypothetical protein
VNKFAERVKSAVIEKLAGILNQFGVDISKIPELLYTGRPRLYSELSGQNGRGLFLTPYKGIASLFTADRKGAVSKIIGPGTYNRNYKQWGWSPEELEDILKHIDILHNSPSKGYGEGIAEGYIYPVKTKGILDQLKYNAKDNGRSMQNELVYDGIVRPEAAIKTKIPFSVEFDPVSYEKRLARLKAKGL